MPRFLVAEGEDLLAEFRPHPASYIARYLVALLWVGVGVVATLLELRETFLDGWLGLGLLALFAVAFAVTARVLHRPGLVAGLVWAAAAVGAGFLPDAVHVGARPFAVGALAGLATFVHAELDRSRRSVHVTTRRIVVRGGLGRLDEHTVELDRVASVRATQSLLGQMFHYGTLIVTLESKGRPRKAGALAPSEILSGVPKSQEVRAAIEAGLEERKLSPKDRTKRAEERRLKSSMRALAAWAPRD